jgi:hypothetical protein
MRANMQGQLPPCSGGVSPPSALKRASAVARLRRAAHGSAEDAATLNGGETPPLQEEPSRFPSTRGWHIVSHWDGAAGRY